MCLICNVVELPDDKETRKAWLTCVYCHKEFETVFKRIHQHGECNPKQVIFDDAYKRLERLN